MGLSQGDFARQFGFSVDTVQNWEQGHRKPAGSARVLLTIIQREPKAVRRALAADLGRKAAKR
jgi:putative transcriptional regulator